jgi:hypothetical protein
MSFFAGLAVNTLFEQLSGELLQARYENARYESIREACRLILRDEAWHIQFGRIIMRRFFGAPEPEKALLGAKLEEAPQQPANGVRGGEPARGRAQALGLQPRATPNGAWALRIGRRGRSRPPGLDIRADVALYGVPIPRIPEIDDVEVPPEEEP